AEDSIRSRNVTVVQTCALPICTHTHTHTHSNAKRESTNKYSQKDDMTALIIITSQLILCQRFPSPRKLHRRRCLLFSIAVNPQQIGRASCREQVRLNC